MRKMLLTPLIVCMVVLLSTLSMPAVSAQPMKPLRCELEIELDWVEFKWFGTITGDIEGTFTIFPDPEPSFPGILEHYLETWVIEIETDDGDTIELIQEGVWSFKTFKFKSNGWVTAATGTWAYLLGSDAHVRGVTTEFLGPPYPIYGTGTMWLCGFGPE